MLGKARPFTVNKGGVQAPDFPTHPSNLAPSLSLLCGWMMTGAEKKKVPQALLENKGLFKDPLKDPGPVRVLWRAEREGRRLSTELGCWAYYVWGPQVPAGLAGSTRCPRRGRQGAQQLTRYIPMRVKGEGRGGLNSPPNVRRPAGLPHAHTGVKGATCREPPLHQGHAVATAHQLQVHPGQGCPLAGELGGHGAGGAGSRTGLPTGGKAAGTWGLDKVSGALRDV